MARYSENAIETIRNRLTLSDVASSYVKLQRRGKENWCCCPFHSEKTPSMVLHDDTGFFKCFGCGKAGTIFTFVQEMEHVTYNEAVEMLAQKAGVELRQASEKEKQESSRKQVLQDIYNRISTTFHHILLNTPQGEYARNYLAKRGISSETIEKFNLGFAPDDGSWLYSFLSGNNYSDDILKDSGFFSRNYEKLSLFRNRIMFPVRDSKGNCVAFSSRDLSGNSPAKYLNTPETVLYSKRNNLFGFYESIPRMKEKKEIIICEGNFDVISLHQAGLDNAAASLGTAFTEEQVRNLIKRYCEKVRILFDSDGAGQAATAKALVICQKHDIPAEVLHLDGAKDASQMLEEQGPQALVQSCVKSEPGFRYLVSSAIKMYDIRQPKGKSSVLKEVKPYLDATSSEIERQGYIKYLSDVLRTPEEAVLSEYLKNQSQVSEPESENSDKKNKEFNIFSLSPDLNAMLVLLNNRNLFEKFRSRFRISDLDDENARIIFAVLEDASREDISSNEMVLQMIEDDELRNLAYSSFNSPMFGCRNAEKALEDAARQIAIKRLEEKQQNILRLINSGMMDDFSSDEISGMLQEKSSLDREIEELKKRL